MKRLCERKSYAELNKIGKIMRSWGWAAIAAVAVILIAVIAVAALRARYSTKDAIATETKLYKMYTIEQGDSLWSIAEEYVDYDHYDDIRDYVDEVIDSDTAEKLSSLGTNYSMVKWDHEFYVEGSDHTLVASTAITPDGIVVAITNLGSKSVSFTGSAHIKGDTNSLSDSIALLEPCLAVGGTTINYTECDSANITSITLHCTSRLLLVFPSIVIILNQNLLTLQPPLNKNGQ